MNSVKWFDGSNEWILKKKPIGEHIKFVAEKFLSEADFWNKSSVVWIIGFKFYRLNWSGSCCVEWMTKSPYNKMIVCEL